jgi:hypothetical protein
MRFAASIALLLVGCAHPEPYATAHHDNELAGRSAGAPERCILVEQSEAFRVADNDRHTLLYGSGKTVWAAHLAGMCGFSLDDILISQPWGAHHCRGDIIHSLERGSQAPGPSCILGDFVPYTR